MLLAVLGLGLSCSLPVQAQLIDDIAVGYDHLVIDRVQSGSGWFDIPQITRDYVTISVARGAFSVGLAFQHTRSDTYTAADFAQFIPKDAQGGRLGEGPPTGFGGGESRESGGEGGAPSFADAASTGTMLTASYQKALSYRVRIESFARVQALQSTEVRLFQARLSPSYNDVRVNLVFFNPDGNGFFRDRPYFASWYVGGAVNNLGRVQTTLGGGVWWNNLNVYITGYFSLNGATNPFGFDEGIVGRERDLAYIKEHGVSVSLSYDWRNFVFSGRKNIPIENSGNDTAFSIHYRYFFR
ncbi:MAG: hypothetical protein RhofKO_02200 [Rhodothermales bacterium]